MMCMDNDPLLKTFLLNKYPSTRDMWAWPKGKGKGKGKSDDKGKGKGKDKSDSKKGGKKKAAAIKPQSSVAGFVATVASAHSPSTPRACIRRTWRGNSVNRRHRRLIRRRRSRRRHHRL